MVRGKHFSLSCLLLMLALPLQPGLACRDRDAKPTNLVLISIDSLRADRVGCYGAERETSPAIDALAAEGALFEHAIAPSSWTLPTHVSLLTGLSTAVHRVNHPDRRIDPARGLLAEGLREHGFRTAGFVSAPYLHRAYGFDRGFDLYENLQGEAASEFPPSLESHEASHTDQTAQRLVGRAIEWLSEQRLGGDPWFLFVHLWDVHYDYLPPPAYVEQFDADYAGDLDPRDFLANTAIHAGMPERDLRYLRALYDAEVRALDAQIGRLLKTLRARESSERIVIALVSDHGDEFFEHGNKGHTRTLFEESVRVPWLLRAPGVTQPGARISQVVSLEDVAPTLLSLVGAPPLAEATGRDLGPMLRGQQQEEVPALLLLAPQVALRGTSWKVIANARTGVARYYDLATDPGEQHPLAAEQVAPEKLQALSSRLSEAQAYAESLTWQGAEPVELDERTRARLRELGYVE